jgi:hypothetical protein
MSEAPIEKAGTDRSRLAAMSLFEDPEVAEQPPQDDEDEDGAEAAASEFLGTVSRGNAAQQLTHRRFAS